MQYLVIDGHFGNYPSAWMVVQNGLHFVSKLRWDAVLYEPFSGKYRGRGPHPKYGDKTEDGIRIQIYQATLLNREFAFPINVVVILKTNLSTQAQAPIILFGTDLKLSYETISLGMVHPVFEPVSAA